MQNGQKLIDAATGAEVCLYPGKTMALTQGMGGSYSHAGSQEWDDAGEDAGVDNRYAPARAYCGHKDPAGGVNGVNWWLTDVLCRDGKRRDLTLRLIHDDYVGDVHVGTVRQQGEVIGNEGKTGGGATGNHTHFNVAEGHLQGSGLIRNPQGVYELRNELDPTTVFFMDGTNMKRTYGYDWGFYKDYKAQQEAEQLRLAAEVARAEALRAEAARIEALRLEAERKAAAQAEFDRIAQEKAEAERLALLADLYYPIPNYNGGSIVDGLEAIKVNSGFMNRKAIANKNGFVAYLGLGGQNVALLRLLKVGKLKRV